MGLSPLVALIALQAPQLPPEFDAYLHANSKGTFSVASKGPGRLELDLTSQTWQGIPWKHRVVIQSPSTLRHKGIAVLAITGGGRNAKDLAWAKRIADGALMPAVSLFDIPNQPIFGLREDELIAHTFEQYLKTGKADWPLLFPMANSALRAMDAVSAATKGSKNPIKSFIVTGESKRGWTTWMVGASADARVRGIVPMIYDNLNLAAQMKRQMDEWGRYSPMIAAYTDKGLQQVLETPPGKKLAAMVDPWAYRSRIKAPLLMVHGSNDPFWTTDAIQVYWKALGRRKALVVMPNRGHEFPGDKRMDEGLIAFARACAGEFLFPNFAWESLLPPRVRIGVWPPDPVKLSVWRAESDSLDFTRSKWRIVDVKPAYAMPNPRGLTNYAYTVEARYKVNGIEFSLFAPPQVLGPIN